MKFMTVKYIENRIEDEINYYLKKNPFIEREDILKVVQMIDTDGAFYSQYHDTAIRNRKNGIF